jgi:hypothetical protein
MDIDMDALRSLVEQAYVKVVHDAFGEPGTRALRPLLLGIRNIYTRVEPEHLTASLVVFSPLDPMETLLPRNEASEFTDVASLPDAVRGPCIVEVAANGRYYVWLGVTGTDALSERAVVYVYSNRVEAIRVRDQVCPIPRTVPAMSSTFAVPAFTLLSDALEHYRVKLAKHCMCGVLAQAWRDERRLMFVRKPEVMMRRSLDQFLSSVIRGAEVRPEQSVDESHPVDLKVTWDLTRRIALIEIKWIGDSYNDGNDPLQWRDARAKDGAQQLAEYLDANRERVPGHVSRGYLVVFDGRRKGLTREGELSDSGDVSHYANKDVVYDPDYAATRDDFAAPIRMFIEAKVA